MTHKDYEQYVLSQLDTPLSIGKIVENYKKDFKYYSTLDIIKLRYAADLLRIRGVISYTQDWQALEKTAPVPLPQA